MLLVMVVVTALVTVFVTFGVMDRASMLPTVIKFVLDWVKISNLDLILALLLVMPLSKDEFEQFDRYSMMDSKNSHFDSKTIFYIDDIRYDIDIQGEDRNL